MRRVRVAVLLYGVFACLAGTIFLQASVPDDFAWSAGRGDRIGDAHDVLTEGGPPLLGSGSDPAGLSPPLESRNPNYPGQYYPAGVGDDQGIFLYLPLLGQYLDESDPGALLKSLFVGLFAPLMLFYPLVFYELFASLVAAVISPFLLLMVISQLKVGDVYWIPAWLLLACLPIVFLLARKPWTNGSVVAVAVVALVASFGDSVRSNAGLPVVLAASGVVLVRERGWSRKAATIALVIVAYVAVSDVAMERIRIERDRAIGHAGLSARYPPQHNLWHTAYIGLGYFPNPYGLSWSDAVGREAGARANPRAEYLSPEYEATMRRLFFEFALDHPQVVVSTMFRKLRYAIGDARERFPISALLVPVLFVLGRRDERIRVPLLLAAPALLLGIVAPVLSIPVERYEAPWIGAFGLVWILAVIWTIDAVRRPVTRALGQRSPPSSPGGDARFFRDVPHRVLWRSAIPLAAVAVLTVALLKASPSDVERLYIVQATQLASESAPGGAQVRSWNFSDVPAAWTVGPGIRVEEGSTGLNVDTGTSVGLPVLETSETLAPGDYEIWVDGRVRAGGLAVLVVDERHETWLASAVYWSRQPFEQGRMVFPLKLTKTTPVRLLLANWRPKGDGSSTWVIRRIVVTKTPT